MKLRSVSAGGTRGARHLQIRAVPPHSGGGFSGARAYQAAGAGRSVERSVRLLGGASHVHTGDGRW